MTLSTVEPTPPPTEASSPLPTALLRAGRAMASALDPPARDHNGGAFGREPMCDRAADPAAAAGDEAPSAVEPAAHACTFAARLTVRSTPVR